ncbi:CoA transferase, partial [Mycobacterium interjectum]|nr:CoA transferase [Mycobacterium interjectum]
MVGVSSASSSWGSSGLACLTGLPDGPPDFSRAHVLARAEEVATAVRRRTGVRV